MPRARLSLKELRSAVGRLVGQAPWGVADQGLISLSNLVLMVLLARQIGQGAFGRFVLVYSVLWLVNVAQNGLFTQPHNLVGPTLGRQTYRRYTGSTAMGQGLLTASTLILIFGGWLVTQSIGWIGSPLVLALGPTVVCWQGREFTRRVLYTEGRVGHAFANDLLCYGSQTLVLAGLWWTQMLSGSVALWTLTGANALGAGAGLWHIRHSWTPCLRRADLLKNWQVGKWLVGGQLVGGWLSGGIILYLTAGVLGVAAAGVIQAIHTLFGPGRVLAQAMVTMLPIRFSGVMRSGAITGEDRANLRGEVRRVTAWAGPSLGLMCLLLAAFAQPILRLVYGPEYAAYEWTMAIYAASMYLSYLSMIPSSALKSALATRTVFMNRLVAGMIALPSGVGLMWWLGLPGAAMGYLVTDGIKATLDFWAYRRLLGPKASDESQTPQPRMEPSV